MIPPAVLTWVVETVLEHGEALLRGVPEELVSEYRKAARTALKATIGGTVTTRALSPTTVWVHSPLVRDAVTEEQKAHEQRSAAELLEEGPGPEPWTGWRTTWDLLVDSSL